MPGRVRMTRVASSPSMLGISRSTLYRKVETYQLRSLARPLDEGDSTH